MPVRRLRAFINNAKRRAEVGVLACAGAKARRGPQHHGGTCGHTRPHAAGLQPPHTAVGECGRPGAPAHIPCRTTPRAYIARVPPRPPAADLQQPGNTNVRRTHAWAPGPEALSRSPRALAGGVSHTLMPAAGCSD